jgi:hypothetical protein
MVLNLDPSGSISKCSDCGWLTGSPCLLFQGDANWQTVGIPISIMFMAADGHPQGRPEVVHFPEKASHSAGGEGGSKHLSIANFQCML